GATDRRAPADAPLLRLALVFAHELVAPRLALFVLHLDGGAEEDHVGLLRSRIDHLRGVEPLLQEADAAIDLLEAELAVLVLGVLRTVTVGSRRGHVVDRLRAFYPQQAIELLGEAPRPPGRDVVLHGKSRRADGRAATGGHVVAARRRACLTHAAA